MQRAFLRRPAVDLPRPTPGAARRIVRLFVEREAQRHLKAVRRRAIENHRVLDEQTFTLLSQS
jgi:hypothetical protein